MLLLACATLSFVLVTDEWILVETQNCKIYFPQKPTDQSGIVNTALGDLKVAIYTYRAPENVGDDNLAYILSETQYPDSLMNSDKKDKLDAFFRTSIDGVLNNFHGQLLAESKTAIDGFPGREVRIDIQKGKAVMNMRFYLVRNRMYVLETITNSDKDFNKSIERFMSSFAVTN